MHSSDNLTSIMYPMNHMHPAPTKIALLQHTGGGNLGDEASVEVAIRNIRQRWPNAGIALLSMNPDNTAMVHGIPSFPMRAYRWTFGYKSAMEPSQVGKWELSRWLRTTRTPVIRLPRAVLREVLFLIESLRIIRAFDLMVLSGGGQLTERSGPWGFPYAIFIWSLIAKAAGVKYIILNVGAGPLNQVLSKFFVRRALFAAEYVSFRDQQSQALARDIGFTGPSEVFPDIVYNFAVASPATSCSGGGRQPIVGVAPYPLASTNNPAVKMTYEELTARFATFAASLIRRSYSLAFFGTDIGIDPAAIEDVRTMLRVHHDIVTSPYEPVKSVHELLSRMSRMDYVVTCRFHGVVFAHLLNKPVLALSPHPKVANLMDALGLSKYCVDIRAFDPDRLADKFVCLVQDSDIIKRQMAATLAKYKSLLRVQFDNVLVPYSFAR